MTLDLLLPLVYVIPLGLLLWALIAVLKYSRLRDIDRLIWVIVIIFVPCFGPILYFVIGGDRRSRPRDYISKEAPRPPDDMSFD